MDGVERERKLFLHQILLMKEQIRNSYLSCSSTTISISLSVFRNLHFLPTIKSSTLSFILTVTFCGSILI